MKRLIFGSKSSPSVSGGCPETSGRGGKLLLLFCRFVALRNCSSIALLLCLSVALLLCCSVALSYAFNQPDTGQTKCYRDVSPWDEIPCAGTGQDGEYNINPMSYTNNGNGTVTDNNTGLMWQRQDDGNTYNWYKASGTYDATYNPSSQDVCGELTTGSYTDWRLPSKKELTSIVDYSIPYPGPTINPIFTNTKQSNYWSSTTSASYPNSAWHVHFNDGYVSYYGKGNNGYVRCVRGGENACSSPAQHYKCLDGTDGTNQISSPTKWSWTCGTASCSERKSPGEGEN